MKKYNFICEYCDSEFLIEGNSEDEVSYCPYCGEECTHIEDLPLLKTFEDMDEFNEMEYYNKDE